MFLEPITEMKLTPIFDMIEGEKSGFKELVESRRIGFHYFYSPATALTPIIHTFDVLVTLNATYYKSVKYEPAEIAASILHELGHLFNCPPDKKASQELQEFYADDYARNWSPRFSQGLSRALTKDIRENLYHLDKNKLDSLQTRIDRIVNNEPLFTDGVDSRTHHSNNN